MNKRDFVVGACAAAAAGLGHATPGIDASDQETRAPGRLARWPDLALDTGFAAWSHYVGESFASPGLAGSLVLRSALQHHFGQGGEQFTLVFESGAAQGTHRSMLRLQHPATGQRISVFVQDAGQGKAGTSLLRAEYYHLA